jgi:hypothetical protein
MAHVLKGYKKSILLAVPVLLCGLLATGCDERVEIMRNRDIPVLKHQTWAWRPAPAKAEAKNERPVVSRDVIGGRTAAVAPEQDPAYETVRQELRTAIERQLTEKGLTQVSDPAAADFLVDYHFAMRRHNATVARVYPGAYPGLVCGPFGCWREWGYGTFVFDFFQREPKGLAYRANGLEPPYRTAFTQDQVNDMVHALLKGLKPKGK